MESASPKAQVRIPKAAWQDHAYMTMIQPCEAFPIERQHTLLDLLFERSYVGKVLIDDQRHIVRVNQAYAQLLGYQAEELIGRSIDELTHPNDLTPARHQFQQMLTDASLTARQRKRYITKDGRLIWVDRTASRIEIAGQVFILGEVVDVTAQVEAMQELETIYQTAPIGLALLDANGRFVRVNARLAEINGIPADQHIGHTIREIVPHIADQAQALIAHVQATGEPQLDIEITGETSSQPGVRRSWNESWYPLKDETDQVVAMNIVVVETTERRQSEVLREGYIQQLEQLAETARCLQSTLDVQDIGLLAAAHASLLLGTQGAYCCIRPQSDPEQPLRVVFCQEQGSHVLDQQQEHERIELDEIVCTTNQPLRLTQAQLEAHPCWLSLQALVTHSQLGDGWLAVPLCGHGGRNLGLLRVSRKEATAWMREDEAMLVQLAQLVAAALENAHLYQQAQRAIQLRDTFISVAAHELKTPLTLLMGNTQLLLRRSIRDRLHNAEQERVLHTIIDQVNRLNRRITTLLDISFIEAGQLHVALQPLTLCHLVKRTISDLQQSSPKHHLEYTCRASYSIVLGDEQRLEQVLYNLLQNAIKYSPDGGTIQVCMEQIGEQIAIRIRDHGMGIPEEELPKLFQRFYRAGNVGARDVQGMGIGLFVSHEIIALHGGTIHIESTEGRGSTFTMMLPLLDNGVVLLEDI